MPREFQSQPVSYDEASGVVPPAWSPEQVVRIAQEWRQAQWNFAYHPVVRILPLEGDPPAAYHAEYRLRHLIVSEQGPLAFADACAVEIVLPEDFPNSSPIVRPLQKTFHPNVDAEYVKVIPPWRAGGTLTDVVQRVGHVLAFRIVDEQDVWNPAAQQWLDANRHQVPIDPTADLSTTAGGQPLERICRAGPAALPALREQVQLFTEWLLDPARPPGSGEVQHFIQRTRVATRLFLGADLPESISSQAAQIDKWAAALPGLAASCASIRHASAAVSAASAVAADLTASASALAQHFSSLDSLGPGTPSPPNDVRQLLRQLAPAPELQKAQGTLRAALLKAEQRLTAARSALAAITPPKLPGAAPSAVRAALEKRAAAHATAAEHARTEIAAALAAADPLVARARAEAVALDRLLLWREFADLMDRARALTTQATDLGPAGIQAYFLDNTDGKHGPFQFEEQVDTDAAQVCVRRTSGGGIEAVDLTRGLSLGRTDATAAATPAAAVANASAGASANADLVCPIRPDDPAPTTFRPTPRCEDLAIQFEYAANQNKSLLAQLAGPWRGEGASSWCGRCAATLARPESIARAREDHATLAFRWASLAADLHALEPIKQRLCTFFLLLRVRDTLPRYRRELAAALAVQERAAAALAPILARSSTDPTTGVPVIPAKFHKEYQQLVSQRDAQAPHVERLTRATRTAISQVKTRMSFNAMIGHAVIPHFAILPPFRPPLTDAVTSMADAPLLALLTEVERLAGMTLYAGKRPVTAVAADQVIPQPPPIPSVVAKPQPPPAAAPATSTQRAAAAGGEAPTAEAFAIDESDVPTDGDEDDVMIDWPGT